MKKENANYIVNMQIIYSYQCLAVIPSHYILNTLLKLLHHKVRVIHV